MPTYVYKNLRTGERFIVHQSIHDPHLATHPETGDPIKRIIQPVAVAFRGPGFYSTDNKKEGTKCSTECSN